MDDVLDLISGLGKKLARHFLHFGNSDQITFYAPHALVRLSDHDLINLPGLKFW